MRVFASHTDIPTVSPRLLCFLITQNFYSIDDQIILLGLHNLAVDANPIFLMLIDLAFLDSFLSKSRYPTFTRCYLSKSLVQGTVLIFFLGGPGGLAAPSDSCVLGAAGVGTVGKKELHG